MIYDTLVPFAHHGDPYIQFALGHISYHKSETSTTDGNGEEDGDVWQYTRIKQGWKMNYPDCYFDCAMNWSRIGLNPFKLELVDDTEIN